FSRGHWPTEAIWQQEEFMDEAKPFKIPKREVWAAFQRVKANQGAAGVDGQSIAEFEADLKNNLYKLWNRLSSGSYFPPPVRRVDIPSAMVVASGRWVFQLWPTESPRKSLGAIWNQSWSRCFIPTPTVTDPANLRSTPCAQRESAADAPTGYS